MTNIEQKALALVNEVQRERGLPSFELYDRTFYTEEALCRAIEQHEAFRQEVSDAVAEAGSLLESIAENGCLVSDYPLHSASASKAKAAIARFIIAKPDPLVEAVGECDDGTWETKAEYANKLRAAIEKRGGKIVWGEG